MSTMHHALLKNLIFIATQERCENVCRYKQNTLEKCHTKTNIKDTHMNFTQTYEGRRRNEIIFDGDNRNVILHVKQSYVARTMLWLIKYWMWWAAQKGKFLFCYNFIIENFHKKRCCLCSTRMCRVVRECENGILLIFEVGKFWWWFIALGGLRKCLNCSWFFWLLDLNLLFSYLQNTFKVKGPWLKICIET